jgi:rfaE bifunctional protein kinase chain/domain
MRSGWRRAGYIRFRSCSLVVQSRRMTPARFDKITREYRRLCLAVVGDFCLDRYLEIDPARAEISIETGLPVHNVVRVRSQPGAAGTILNNLVALGVGEIWPVGFGGLDGEGYELLAALKAMRDVQTGFFLQTPDRRTFTYCKPLVIEPRRAPRELSRLDSKNWTPTPAAVRRTLNDSFEQVAARAHAIILMDQVDLADTGVITSDLLEAVKQKAATNPELLMLADSRRSLRNWPPVALKMNERELAALLGQPSTDISSIAAAAAELARRQSRPVFITLAARGIVGAAVDGSVEHVPAFPVQGEIDIVGAGDAVTANLTAALAAGATLHEALELAMAAASVVIHQLGTTGTATMEDLRARLLAPAI